MRILLALASFALATLVFFTRLSPLDRPAHDPHVQILGASLGMLGVSFAFVVGTSGRRLRRAGTGPVLLASWQRQVRAFIVLATLPMCALALAVIIPTTQLAFGVVYLLLMLEALVLFAASIWVLDQTQHRAAQ
jgi:hypothetical protein